MTAVLSGNTILEPLRAALFPSDGGGLSDGQLLERFLAASAGRSAGSRDGAFAALVRRHQGMVWGVCRRVLSSFHDAEDAFQATFLILVKRADSVVPREHVGNWLYGVAYRTALEARTAAARRRARTERLRHAVPREAFTEEADGLDLRPLIDRELCRLPECYRAAVVLCDLQGKSRKEAARELGLAEGTLSSRLARARRRLARRLAPLGVSAGAFAALLSAQTASAGVPTALVRSTVHIVTGGASASVTRLMEGVLRTMFMTKLKVAFAVLLTLGLLALGAGVVALQAFAGQAEAAKEASAGDAPKEKKDQGPELRGSLRSVDAARNTITIAVLVKADSKETQDHTFPLAAGARVILEDRLSKNEPEREGKLADLSDGEGIYIVLQLTGDKKSATVVTAFGPGLHAGVRGVDVAGNAIIVGVKESGGVTDKTFVLAKEAKILLNDGLSKDTPDREGKLADLSEGTPVQLRLSVDRRTALEVRVQGLSVHGRLKSYDAGNRIITVIVKENGALVDRSFAVAKEAALNDLSEGLGVHLRMSVFDKETVVEAQGKKEGEESE